MKQFLLLFIVSTAFTLAAKAQTDDPPPLTEKTPPQTDDSPKRYLVTSQGDTIRSTSENGFTIFRKVLIEPYYPGGSPGWHRFIKKNLVYPDSLKEQKVEGTVWLQFIVHRDGRICDLEFLSGNELLKEAALATMRRSPDWEPCSMDGRIVTAYRKLAIVFRLADVEDKPQTPSFFK